ncbi:MAG: hypothetical protein DIU60_018235 [Actinomycetes bacterium]|jgi:Mce-associated membrane protein|nr:MAG: hypothetical protein DIU60_02735 [Actinomycetota bacterium]
MERRTPRLVVTLALAGVVLALAAALVWIRIELAAARTAAEDREAAMRAAAMHAVSLISLNHRTVDEDIRRILATSTGEARQAHERHAPELRRAALSAKVVQTGVVRAVGLVSMNAAHDTAEVLVVADAVNRFEDTEPRFEERFYRWTMRVSKVGGAWLVSKAEQTQ